MDNKGITYDFNDNNTVLVAFGGINQRMGMPIFEFHKTISGIQADKIFIRDFSQAWYQKGIDFQINSISALIDHLRSVLFERNYDRVCFIGNSMGGFAAILLGTILNVDHIIAFSPQTFIDKWNRLYYLDFRWKNQINSVHKNKNKIKEYFDLKSFLPKKTYNSIIEVYYSPLHRLDRIHAKRLKNIKNIDLNKVYEGGHAIVKTLKNEGILLKKISQSLKIEEEIND
jgi:hypothetical protein